jgi:hypothetical protein
MGVSLFSPNAVRQRNDEIVRNGKMAAWLDAYHRAFLEKNDKEVRIASDALAKLRRGEDV